MDILSHFTNKKISQLYHLEPQGIGTAFIESLSGYITRLSQEHCIRTGDLFTKILFPYLNKSYLHNIIASGGNGFFDSSHIINGVSTASAEYASMLEELTGNTAMDKLTLLKFKDILPTRGLLKTIRAWCPVCYQQMQQQESIIYEPLIWNLKSVNVCIQHQVALCEECLKCSKNNKVLERRSVPGFCTHCSAWLGEKEYKVKPLEEWEWVKALMVEEMFTKDFTLKAENISNSIRKIVEYTTNSNTSEFARRIGVPKTTFWTWYSGNNKPTLEDVMRICNKFGLSIVNFYTNQLVFNKASIFYAKRQPKINKNITKIPLFEVRKKMDQIVLDKETASISVNNMAAKISCNKKIMYKYYNDLCRIQALRNKLFRLNSRIKRINFLNTKVNAVVSRYDTGDIPTRNKLETILNKPAMFKERSIRENYKQIQNSKINTIYR